MLSLITGGAGFIGSHVVRHCLAAGHQVVVLDDLSSGRACQVPAGATLIQGSTTDDALVARIFREHRIDYVYHLAAYASENSSHFVRRHTYANTLAGSINLINESIAHDVRCFVFTSSIAVYGHQPVPMNEEMVPLPQDPYGIAKYAVELDLEAARRTFGLRSIVFRPHNVYGPHQSLADTSRNVIAIFMMQILQGRPLTVFGDGTQQRAFTYIDDVAPLIARSVTLPAAYDQTINIGASEPCSLLELASQVSRTFGVPPRIDFLPQRHEVVHAFADHARARRIFGVNGGTPLPEGLSRMAEWVKSAGMRAEFKAPAIEIGRTMLRR